MKILIVGNGHLLKINNAFFLEKHSVKFINELESLGCSVVWHEPVHSELKYNVDDIHDESLGESVEVFIGDPINRSFIGKLCFYVNSFFKLLLKSYDIDCAYIFWPGKLGYISIIAMLITGKPYGIYIRSTFNESSVFTKFVFKKAKFILATGSLFRDKLLSFNINSHLVTAMINVNREDVYKRTIVNNEVINILFVGRISEGKGIWPMLEAANSLHNKGLNFKLHLVGGGAEMAEVLSFVDKNYLKESIVIYGLISNKENLAELYRSCDVFLLPTFFEGFPRVLYEAMTYSLPIITTFVGSIPSIMKKNWNCLEIPVNDSGAIVTAVEKLVDDVSLRRYLSTNAADCIMDYFDTKCKFTHAQQVHKLMNGEKI